MLEWPIHRNVPGRTERGDMADILIRRGRVIDPATGMDDIADVHIADGVVRDIGQLDIASDRTIGAQGMIVCPGFVDMHVHLRQPGDEESETIQSGTSAALVGGFTSVACMPNTNPPLDSKRAIAMVLHEAARAGLARVYPIGALTKGREGRDLVNFERLMKAGAVAFSDDGDPVVLKGVMQKALTMSRRLGFVVIDHCEVPKLTGDGVVNEGAISKRLHLPGIPRESETEMVARDLELAEKTRGRLHIAHVSCAQCLTMIRDARKRGVRVTCEVTPHHVALSDRDVLGAQPSHKMKPPLRLREDMKTLARALANESIDVMATDHAPHSSQKKDRGFHEAPFGAIGLESALAVLSTVLVHKGRAKWPKLIKKMTHNPAQILGIPGGRLEIGSPADLVIVDPDHVWTIDSSRFHSKSRNCPFDGWRVRGKVMLVIVGGEIKFEEES